MTPILKEEPCCQTRGTSGTLAEDPTLPLRQHWAQPSWMALHTRCLGSAWPRPGPQPLTSEQSHSVQSGRAGWMWLSDRWSLSPFREDKNAKGEKLECGFVLNQRTLQIPLASGWRPRDMGPGTCDLLFSRLPSFRWRGAPGGCAVILMTPSPNRGHRTDHRACGTSATTAQAWKRRGAETSGPCQSKHSSAELSHCRPCQLSAR